MAIQVGSTVRVVRPGRRVRSGFAPMLGETGLLVGHYPDDSTGYVYAVAFDKPHGLGMTLSFHADELEKTADPLPA